MNEPTFGLFEDEGRVWWSGPNFPNHAEDEEQLFDNYPVVVALEAVDFHDGDGWGRHKIEPHAEILDSYWYDVGAGHENYVVLAKFENEQDLLAVLKEFEPLEELYERP